MLLWYNAQKKAGTLPVRYRDWPLRDIERDLGIGAPARDGYIFRFAPEDGRRSTGDSYSEGAMHDIL